MTTATYPKDATALLDFLRANANLPPEQRCETMVATRLTSDTRGFRRMIRTIGDLAYKGVIVRGNVENWACVLSLPEVVDHASRLLGMAEYANHSVMQDAMRAAAKHIRQLEQQVAELTKR